MIDFFAKITNQPNPETWIPQNETPQTQNVIQRTEFETSQQKEQKEGTSFFDKLVNSTQNLLSKTENFVSIAADKTKQVTQQIREVPSKIVDKTNTAIQKGIDIWEKVKDRAENITDKGITFGKNLQTTMSDGTKQFTQNPLKAAENIMKESFNSTVQLGKDLWKQAEEIGGNTIDTIKTTWENIKDWLKNAGQEIQLKWGKIETKATNIFWEIKEAGTKVIKKTKEAGTNAFNTAQDIVKNPVNHIDNVIWSESEKAVPIQTETANTTSLENLENKSETQNTIPEEKAEN